MTLAQTAQGAGTTAAQIMKLENGDRRLTLDWLERLSRALGCHVLDLIAPTRSIAVSGFLTTSWSVQDVVNDPRHPGMPDAMSVPVPRGCDPERILAIRRQTLDKTDFFGDATFYFEDAAPAPLETYDGRICLLTMASGQRHVRRVVLDSTVRRVHFHAPGEPPQLGEMPASWMPCLAITGGPKAVYALCGPQPAASNDADQFMTGRRLATVAAQRI